jgi:putative flippase GtrA
MSKKQFVKYTMVGGLGTAVHYCVLVMVYEGWKVDVLVSTTIGAIVGAVLNYVLNYFFTFKSKKRHGKTFIRFFIVALIGLLLNYIVIASLPMFVTWHYLLSQVVATSVVLIVGYFFNKFWTFGQT